MEEGVLVGCVGVRVTGKEGLKVGSMFMHFVCCDCDVSCDSKKRAGRDKGNGKALVRDLL